MNDPQPPPVRGLVAGKYEIVRLIGRGGMGSVWEGRHASLGTRVAVKFIDQEYVGSREAQSRFATEARAAATIQSKHAIQIFDHGVTDDGRPYIVMELLLGEPLDKRIERLGRIPLQETARIVGQVCRALQRAHDAGIVHRDLKPENIFLVRSPDDDDEIAKVLDFGIAKIKGPPGGHGSGALTSSTKTGAVLGTPYYMSPEQARGLRTIDHRSDLWSLGVIAYKCVTGILPFEGESVGDLLVKICTGPLPTPSVTTPGLPPSFDSWFARVLEREPARRFATASELAEALAAAAGLSARRMPDPDTTLGRRGQAPLRPTVPLAPLAPMPTAGITSAPFTASARATTPPRGVWIALLAAVVGGSIGVFAVVKLMSPTSAERAQRAAAASTSASRPPATADTRAGAPAALAPAALEVTTLAPGGPAASAAAAATLPGASAASGAQGAPTGLVPAVAPPHAAPKWSAQPPRPAASALSQPAPTTPRPGPAKPPPGPADPGY